MAANMDWHSLFNTKEEMLSSDNVYLSRLNLLLNGNTHKSIKLVRTSENELFKNLYCNASMGSYMEKKIRKMVESFDDKELLLSKVIFNFAKHNSLSEECRQKGNNDFKNKRYAQSLINYNKSLVYAVASSESYCLALGNRSAVFYATKDLKLCLTDLEQCFSKQYPDALKPKLYIRKALCLHQLGLNAEATSCIKEALEFLETLEITSKCKEEFLKKLNAVQSAPVYSAALQEISVETFKLPKFKHGENKTFLSASDAISLKYNSDRGRHVIANQDIKQGDVLFIEEPFTFMGVNELFGYDNYPTSLKCDHCLADVLVVQPCDKCTGKMYCRESCKTAAWRAVHKWECAGFGSGMTYKLGIGNLAFRMLIEGFKKGFNFLDNGPEDDVRGFGCREDNYKYVCKLVTNVQQESRRVLLYYCNMAMLVIFYLRNFTKFFELLAQYPTFSAKSTDETDCFIGGLFVKHLLQISQNASFCLKKYIDCGEGSDGTFHCDWPVHNLCVGLYPSISMMNHSCAPNTTTYNINQHMIVKALEDIKCGGEIFNCYIYHFASSTSHQRYTGLKDTYHFTCRCTECKKPTFSKEIVNSYLCKYCKGPALLLDTQKTAECNNCLKKFNVSSYVVSFEKYLSHIDQFEQSWDNVDLVLKALNITKSIHYKYSEHTIYCCVLLIRYYLKADKFDMYSIFMYANKYLCLVNAAWGPNASSMCEMKIEIIGFVLHRLLKQDLKNAAAYRLHLPKIDEMIKQAEIECCLYFPDEMVQKHFTKMKTLQAQIVMALDVAVNFA